MALVPVTRKPIPAQARKFDGTLDALLDILNARPRNGVSAVLTFDVDGNFTGLTVSGGQVGSVVLEPGDWVIFPDDGEAFTLDEPQALASWQAT